MSQLLLLVLCIAAANAFVNIGRNIENGGSTKLNCSENNEMAPLLPTDVIEWSLPNGTAVMGEWDDGMGRKIENDGNIKGSIMNIYNVMDSNFGFYTCRVSRGSGVAYSKFGLNLGGRHYGDMWERYQMNVLIGGVSAGAVLVVMSFICLVYKFRYKEEAKGSRYDDVSKYTGKPGYTNPALEKSNETIFNSKNGITNENLYDTPADSDTKM